MQLLALSQQVTLIVRSNEATQTTKGDTKANAKAERGQMVARLHRGERVERSSRTVSEALQVWLERGRGPRGPWEPATRVRYEQIARIHVQGSTDPNHLPLGERPLREVTPDCVAVWSQGNERRLTPSIAKLALIVLNQVFRFALRRGWVAENPVARLEPGEKPRWTAKEVRIVDSATLARLLEHTGRLTMLV